MNTSSSKQTNEPQTAEYQAAVDNVWFEIAQNARELKTPYNAKVTKELWGERVHYIVELEIEMELALGRRNLGYFLENF